MYEAFRILLPLLAEAIDHTVPQTQAEMSYHGWRRTLIQHDASQALKTQ